MTTSASLTGPRVAILGFTLEVNRDAPAPTLAQFQANVLIGGARIIEEARSPAPAVGPFVPGFVEVMDAAGPWEPLPILLASASAGGVLSDALWVDFRQAFEDGLREGQRMDAVYINGHGCGSRESEDDLDGEFAELVRAAVGPAIPIVMTLDLHGHVSARLHSAIDVLVAQRTYPHVDSWERGRDAARILRRLLTGTLRPTSALVRVPLITASVSQRTDLGQPLRGLIDAVDRGSESLVDVSILPGFALADVPHAGLSVVVTTDNDQSLADATALELGNAAWTARRQFALDLLSPTAAIEKVLGSGAAPTILADVNDHPGCGGGGNTTALLDALLAARVERCLMGAFVDADLVEAVRGLAVGSEIEFRLNGRAACPFAQVRELNGKLLSFRNEGQYLAERGMWQGTLVDCGPSCAIRIGGVTIAVISSPKQIMDDGLFAMLGLDAGSYVCLALKSSVMFRAGFDHLVPPERIWLVDAPGRCRQLPAAEKLQRAPLNAHPDNWPDTWTPTILSRRRSLNRITTFAQDDSPLPS
jgi:microcystin degradation protein MlrC